MTDESPDQPGWAQTVQRLAGECLIRCGTCGCESETIESFDHHDNCPEKND